MKIRLRPRTSPTSSARLPRGRRVASHPSFERHPAAGASPAAVSFSTQHHGDTMSAQLIYDLVPDRLDPAWSDGTPRPPERHRKKLAAWETSNSQGSPDPQTGRVRRRQHYDPASFTLHEADYGAGGRHRHARPPDVLGGSATCASRSRSGPRSARCSSSTGPATMPSLSISPPIAPPPRNGCPSTAIQMPC
jgi:hypothetical protein